MGRFGREWGRVGTRRGGFMQLRKGSYHKYKFCHKYFLYHTTDKWGEKIKLCRNVLYAGRVLGMVKTQKANGVMIYYLCSCFRFYECRK